MSSNDILLSIPRQSKYLLTTPYSLHNDKLDLPVRADLAWLRGATSISCPTQVVAYGFDTVYLSVNLLVRDGRFFVRLADEKKRLQSGNEKECNLVFTQSGLFSWNLQRTGKRFYPYILKSGDITLQIAERSHESRTPNCIVRFGSLTCHKGLRQKWEMLKSWLKMIDCHVIRDRVQRVDICCDITGSLRELDAWNDDKYIYRARDVFMYKQDGEHSGLQFGSGDIVCRIYEKMREMRRKKASEKMVFFLDYWGVSMDTEVTRTEFQIRGEAIKELFGQDADFETAMKKKDAVWEYLTIDWMRHCTREIDRKSKNQYHYKVSLFWEKIQTVVEDNPFPPIRCKREKHICIKDLARQARGCLITIAAGLGHHVDDIKGILRTIHDVVSNEFEEYSLLQEFRRVFKIKQVRQVVDF
jgi:hypothetical protein